MIYIIISNIGLAIMMIYIYFRYSHFRIASFNEIKVLREKNDKQTIELREFDAKLLSSIKGYQDKVETLLIELGKVRAEKEKEIELKNSIEKKGRTYDYNYKELDIESMIDSFKYYPKTDKMIGIVPKFLFKGVPSMKTFKYAYEMQKISDTIEIKQKK